MLLELNVLSIIGIIFLIVGWSIWKREKINLIHDYHYKNVAEADKKEYTALMGKGAIIIGIGIILTGIIDFITQTGWGWTAFGVCLLCLLPFLGLVWFCSFPSPVCMFFPLFL